MEADVVVIGGGAGGLAAVREARRRDASALLISNAAPGGDCTFFGCVPSKALIAAVAADVGLEEAIARANKASAHIGNTESPAVLEQEAIGFVSGDAELISANEVQVKNKRILAKKGIVLAVGSEPRVFPVAGLPEDRLLTTNTFWDLKVAPKSICIVGAGPIGTELGLAMAKTGVKVSIVDLAERVLPAVEQEASQIVYEALVGAGVDIYSGESLQSARLSGDELELETSAFKRINAEYVLMAAGRKPHRIESAESLGLKTTNSGHIIVDDKMHTSIKDVFAAGDCTPNLALTTSANWMGRVAGANALGKKETYTNNIVPAVTFTTPEVASIGISEAEAAKTYRDAMVAYMPLTEHDRAIASGNTTGYIKLISAERKFLKNAGGGQLVGATVVAPTAGELISELALVMQTKAFVGRIAQTNHAYPSWSYGLAKAAAQFFTTIEGRAARPADPNAK